MIKKQINIQIKTIVKIKNLLILIDVQEKYYKNLEKNNIYKNNQLKLFGEKDKMIRNFINNQK